VAFCGCIFGQHTVLASMASSKMDAMDALALALFAVGKMRGSHSILFLFEFHLF